MTSNAEHSRYRELPVLETRYGCLDSSDGMLKIIVYTHDAELRSHAVKHLLNLDEQDNVWSGLMGRNADAVADHLAALEKIGCPSMTLGIHRPPCRTGNRICLRYHACTSVVSTLETRYLEIIQMVMEESTAIPRVAWFHTTEYGYDAVAMMPDRPIVAKASAVGDQVMNLMTCYAATDLSFSRMRSQQVEMIRNEARNNKPVFCTPETWGLNPAPGPKRKKKKPSSKVRYRKEKYRSWRTHLDDLAEEYL